MFERIAPRYDLLNRLMTAGQDRRWRRQVIRLSGLPEGGRLLDLGAGTGDLSGEALRQHPAGAVRLLAAHEGGSMPGLQEGDAVQWAVGPEGGFSDAELRRIERENRKKKG